MTTTSGQGIMEMIQRKKNVYQNDPQALGQRYEQNKEISDLIALQLLKEEKEAKARDVQLRMQTNPQTIAQQREQEVLGLIKQEQNRGLGQVRDRVRQVGGILGQRQKEAQKRQQRMGMTAAQGGIVGFNKGEMVEGVGGHQMVSASDVIATIGQEAFDYIKENPAEVAATLGITLLTGGLGGLAIRGGLAALRSQGLRSGIKNLMRGKKPDGKPDADFDVYPKGTTVARDRSKIEPPLSKSKELMETGPVRPGRELTDPRLQQVAEVGPRGMVPYKPGMSTPTKIGTLATAAATGIGMPGDDEETDFQDPSLTDVPFPPVESKTPPGVPGMDIDELLEKLKISPPDVEVGTTARDMAKGIATETGLAARATRDPDKVRKSRIEETKEELGLGSVQAKKADQLRRLRTQQERLAEDDPYEAFISGTIGASRRGGPGGFAEGYMGQIARQKEQRRQDLKDDFGIENELMDLEQNILARGVESGDKAMQIASQEKQSYTNIMSRAGQQDIEEASAEATRILNSNIQNVKTELDLIGQQTDRVIENAKIGRATLKDLQDQLATSIEKRTEALAPLTEMLVSEATDFEGGDIAGALDQAKRIEGFILETRGVFAREEDLMRQIEALGGDVTSQRTALQSKQAEIDALKKYLQAS